MLGRWSGRRHSAANQPQSLLEQDKVHDHQPPGAGQKKSLEEEEAKQRNQQRKKSNEEENVQSALTSVPVEPVADPEEQLGEDRNVETMQPVNISFMDVKETTAAAATITLLVMEQPQQPLSLDLDVEMASDNEESSASANNSRSFSPNYSPNQIETSEMNMLNRETSSEQPQPQQVNNLNIPDHPMRGENEEETGVVDASQVPLPTDDDSEESDSSDEDTEDDEEGAVGGALHTLPETIAPEEAAAEVVPPPEMIQDMDPAIRAILGELRVPEGVDQSFLAALPAEMRDEVIQEHLR